MRPFTQHTGLVLPMDRSNVDTDQIIPKQFLKRIERPGSASSCSSIGGSWTTARPTPISSSTGPSTPGRRSCWRGGTSAAGRAASTPRGPWRTTVSASSWRPSFADIFYNNCFKNGLLPVRLDEAQIDDLFARAAAHPGYRLAVDLETCTVSDDYGLSLTFEVDESRRHILLNGLDDIAMTLQHEDKILAYEQARESPKAVRRSRSASEISFNRAVGENLFSIQPAGG